MAGTPGLTFVKSKVFLSGLKSNKTLVEMSSPQKDVRKEVAIARDKRTMEKLNEVMTNINQILKDNHMD